MLIKILCLSILIAIAQKSSANDTQSVTERERLESVINELVYLQTYLAQTKATQPSDGRSRFDYQALQSDLNLVKLGISNYLNHSPRKPKDDHRPFTELDGRYSQ